MKIIAAFIQLLSEDGRQTDTQTDMMKLRHVALNIIIEYMLNVTVTLVNYFIVVL